MTAEAGKQAKWLRRRWAMNRRRASAEDKEMERLRRTAALVGTALYVGLLASLPAFFAHQACHENRRLEMDGFSTILDWLNCHLRFPELDLTLEAYGAWFAAVFASAAVFWAWRSFTVQADTLKAQQETLSTQGDILREQQRATFLAALMRQYHARFSDYAFWMGGEIRREFTPNLPDGASYKKAGFETQALALVEAWTVANKRPARDWAKDSENVSGFLELAHDYECLLKLYGLPVFQSGVWLQLLRKLEALRTAPLGMETAAS